MNRLICCMTILFFILNFEHSEGADATPAEGNKNGSTDNATSQIEQKQKKGKSGYDSDPHFRGPASTTAQLEEDDAVKVPAFRIPEIDTALSSWFDWKREIDEKTGLAFGVAYTTLYQNTNNGLAGAEDEAFSDITRISGRWVLVNRDGKNKGQLVFSVDHRHAFTDADPGGLGFQGGYYGIYGTLFTDGGLIMGDLNWQQILNDGNTGLIVGRFDINDFFDVLGYANPWTTFQNLSILFNASIALPDWSTGAGIGHWLNEQWYVKGAVSDVNGVATTTHFFEDFDELYTTAEIGWSPSREQRYLSNVHVMVWHADDREEAAVEESDGVVVGANWTYNEKTMLFLRAGWSDGSAPLYQDSVTGGLLYYIPARSDLAGFALNWGEPVDETLNDQVSGELFYRLQLAQNLAITPSIQFVKDPALNSDEDLTTLFGLRIRFTF